MKKRCLLASTVLSLALLASSASPDEAFWPCYHGTERDNLSKEKGLLRSWPEGGPELQWRATGLGLGYSSVAVTSEGIYTAGMVDGTTCVIALDLDGKERWRRPNGRSWQASRNQTWATGYSGSRGTPTVESGTVYHLSDMGRLAAFDADDGEERWHLDLLAEFEAECPEYGYSESVLLRGDSLFCHPAGKNAYAAALDKRTGRTLWSNAGIADPVGNASPVIASISGVEQLINVSALRVFSLQPDDGTLLWQHGFGNERENSATDVIVHEGLVYASSGYGKGSVLLRPRLQADGQFVVEEVWATGLLDNHHGGVLLLDGCLYGAGHESRGWFCLDFATGQQRWQARGKGSLTYADDRLYCLEEGGTMTLVEATPEKWSPVGAFEVPSGGPGAYWAHPVVCGGRLYVRHADALYAYRIGGR